MGVYIDMEMPKTCIGCPFSDHEAWCLIPGSWRERYYCPENEISEHCPLIEVPEPHGRLIDADAVEALLQETLGVIPLPLYKILKANTIIPASEEGEI